MAGAMEIVAGATSVVVGLSHFSPILFFFGPFSLLYLIRSLFICLNKIPGIINYL
jgi:hypothetical protein